MSDLSSYHGYIALDGGSHRVGRYVCRVATTTKGTAAEVRVKHLKKYDQRVLRHCSGHITIGTQ